MALRPRHRARAAGDAKAAARELAEIERIMAATDYKRSTRGKSGEGSRPDRRARAARAHRAVGQRLDTRSASLSRSANPDTLPYMEPPTGITRCGRAWARCSAERTRAPAREAFGESLVRTPTTRGRSRSVEAYAREGTPRSQGVEERFTRAWTGEKKKSSSDVVRPRQRQPCGHGDTVAVTLRGGIRRGVNNAPRAWSVRYQRPALPACGKRCLSKSPPRHGSILTIAALVALCAIVIALPAPPGCRGGKRVLAVALLAIGLWCTEALPPASRASSHRGTRLSHAVRAFRGARGLRSVAYPIGVLTIGWRSRGSARRARRTLLLRRSRAARGRSTCNAARVPAANDHLPSATTRTSSSALLRAGARARAGPNRAPVASAILMALTRSTARVPSC